MCVCIHIFLIHSSINRSSVLSVYLPNVHFLSPRYVTGRRKVQPERGDGKREMKPQSENPCFHCCTTPKDLSIPESTMKIKEPLDLSTDPCAPFLSKFWDGYPPPVLPLPLGVEKSIRKSCGSHQLHRGQLLVTCNAGCIATPIILWCTRR